MSTTQAGKTGLRHQAVLLLRSLSSPFLFWFVAGGNTLMLVTALGFYHFEANFNPQVHGIMDAIWWGFTTVTTVGYGDIVPVTVAGRILGIVLMVIGTVFFVGFTAIFVSVLVALHTDYIAIKEEELTMREYRSLMAAIKRVEQRLASIENKK